MFEEPIYLKREGVGVKVYKDKDLKILFCIFNHTTVTVPNKKRKSLVINGYKYTKLIWVDG